MQSKHISHLTTWLISSFVYLVLLFLAFWAFQQPNFYAATLGKISSTYARNPNDSTQIIKVKQPFRAITAQNMVQWDGEYYDYIHRYNYQYQEKAAFSRTNPQFHEAKFAFFPLFPWIWRLSHLAANQVIFLNFGLFILSLAVLIKEFVLHKELQHYLFFFMLLMPSSVIFLIPYSEGVFFSMMTIALVGLKREKYLLVFLGLMGAAMTRPAVTLVGVAVIATEWVLFFKHKNLITLFKQLFLKLFPLLVGTFIVMWVQKENGSGMWFKFMEVQKQWGTHLGLPKGISDWTWEGFGLDVSWLFLCFPLLCYALIRYLYQLFFVEKSSQNLYPDTAILLVSIGYLGLVSCFSLFLRAGFCIN